MASIDPSCLSGLALWLALPKRRWWRWCSFWGFCIWVWSELATSTDSLRNQSLHESSAALRPPCYKEAQVKHTETETTWRHETCGQSLGPSSPAQPISCLRAAIWVIPLDTIWSKRITQPRTAQITQLWKIVSHCCVKTPNFGMVYYTAVRNWNSCLFILPQKEILI